MVSLQPTPLQFTTAFALYKQAARRTPQVIKYGSFEELIHFPSNCCCSLVWLHPHKVRGFSFFFPCLVHSFHFIPHSPFIQFSTSKLQFSLANTSKMVLFFAASLPKLYLGQYDKVVTRRNIPNLGSIPSV